MCLTWLNWMWGRRFIWRCSRHYLLYVQSLLATNQMRHIINLSTSRMMGRRQSCPHAVEFLPIELYRKLLLCRFSCRKYQSVTRDPLFVSYLSCHLCLCSVTLRRHFPPPWLFSNSFLWYRPDGFFYHFHEPWLILWAKHVPLPRITHPSMGTGEQDINQCNLCN